MILRGGAGINCDDGIEFSSVRLSLSHLSLSEIRTHGGRFFFSMKFTHQLLWSCISHKPRPILEGRATATIQDRCWNSSGTPLRGGI